MATILHIPVHEYVDMYMYVYVCIHIYIYTVFYIKNYFFSNRPFFAKSLDGKKVVGNFLVSESRSSELASQNVSKSNFVVGRRPTKKWRD